MRKRMTFSEFFQQNIILFVAAAGILAFLLALEVRGLSTRGLTLNPALLTQRINAGATLIDLRQKADYAAGHIAGAKNIPFDTLETSLKSLGKKEKPIALYCYKGVSSGKAIALLKKHGFTDMVHLQGGMETWTRENLPTAKS